jgi:hypothetical protein
MELTYPLVGMIIVIALGYAFLKYRTRKKFELSRKSRDSREYRRILSRAHGDWKKAERLIEIEMRHNKSLTRQEAIMRIAKRYEPDTVHANDLIVI